LPQLLAAIAAFTVSASPLVAQRAPLDPRTSSLVDSVRVSRLQGGLTVDVAQPVGAFGDNVSSGVGMSGHGLVRLDTRGAASLRLGASFLNYGRDSYRLPLGQGPGGITIPLDRSTWNNVISLGVGPQYAATRGAIRPYVNATAGVAFFTTTASLTGQQGLLSYQYDLTVTDTHFAWTGGAGILVPLWRRTWTAGLLDIGARYQNSGEGVRYLRKGGVRDLPNGAVELDIKRGRADFVAWHAGVSVRLR
jgi:hypothetical protein